MSLLGRPRASAPAAVAAIVAANLVPLAGVLFFGWDLLTLLVVFWLESGIVGLLNVPKILLAGAPGEVNVTVKRRRIEITGPETPPERPTLQVSYLPVAGFFLLHYGIFWVVHGAFVLSFDLFTPAAFPSSFGLPAPGPVLVGAGAAAVGHGVSFVANYLVGGEYRTTTAGERMMAPYGRVLALHLAIVVGGVLVATFGAPSLALAVLVAVKTVGDVGAHLREHAEAKRHTGSGGDGGEPESEPEPEPEPALESDGQ